MGVQALSANLTGHQNTALGYKAFETGTNYSNSMALGYQAAPITNSNQIHLGNSSITEIKGQVAFTMYSDGRVKDNVTEDIVGLDFITKLRPVSYHFNVARQNRLMGIIDSTLSKSKYDIEKIKFSGFIAQEVEIAADLAGYDFSGVKVPHNNHDLYGLSYSEFVVPLVKAVQEQQEIIANMEAENHSKDEKIQELELRLEKIENLLKDK